MIRKEIFRNIHGNPWGVAHSTILLKTCVLINRMTTWFRPKKLFEHAYIGLWIHCNCTPVSILQFQTMRWHTGLSFHSECALCTLPRPHHNWMVNQRLQDGGGSVLPTTQQLTKFSVAKSPDSLPHPVYVLVWVAPRSAARTALGAWAM
jgi:hypothetical protein